MFHPIFFLASCNFHNLVTAGWDAFAFRHPSLGQTDVRRLLDSEAHHHKVSPIGTGRLIALVGVEDIAKAGDKKWQIIFGLVLSITPKPTKNKDELPAARIHRQCNPRYLEVAFLSEEAINFFAHDQLGVLKDRVPCLWRGSDHTRCRGHQQQV